MHSKKLSTAISSAAAALIVLLLAGPADAQGDREVEFQSYNIPGWSFTPSVAVGTTYDSNIALASPRADVGDTKSDWLINVVPAGQLKFLGKHTEFSASYGGFLRRYVANSGLDELAQRASMNFSRTVSRRLSMFLSDSFADSPTTDEIELYGVPFFRAGSRRNSFAAGSSYRLAKFTTLSSRYDMTWVSFDQLNTPLSGGWIHALRNELSQTLNERVSVGVEYSYRTAALDDDRDFAFQDAGGLITVVLGPHTTANAAAGYSLLRDRTENLTRSGLYLRTTLTHSLEHATVGGGYSRHFIPSFGFGGASSSQELNGYIRMPIAANRLYFQGSAAWRHTIPFEADALELDSIWLRSTLGFSPMRWARVEGYYTYARQDSIITGGEVDRHRVGVQLVISQSVRLR